MKNLTELTLYNGGIPKKPDGGYLDRSYLLKPGVTPYLVYTILKEKFGPPNVDGVDEEKQQWQWSFAYEDFIIFIYDWKILSTSIEVYHTASDEKKSKELAEKISLLFEKDATHRKGQIKAMAKSAKHKLLENPFNTYYGTATSLMEHGKKIDDLILQSFQAAPQEGEFGTSATMAASFDMWETKEFVQIRLLDAA